MKIIAAAISLKDANAYVEQIHRHNGSLPAAKFAVAAVDVDGNVHGVTIAGQPKARMANDGGTLEVSRVCSDGFPNCCSFLYSRCIRAAKALGYSRLITYTLDSELGASLKASGWRIAAKVPIDKRFHFKGASINPLLQVEKNRWEIDIAEGIPKPKWPEGIKEELPPSLFDKGIPTKP